MDRARISAASPSRWARWLAALALILGASAGRAEPPQTQATNPTAANGGEVIQASCVGCSNGLLGAAAPYLDHGWLPSGDPGCGEAGCYPGRPCCAPCVAETKLGRLCCAFHDCLCCPDPCYEPHWVPTANAAFFVDHARPTTMTRFRYNGGVNMTLPDRSEFFWAAIGQKGPSQRELSVDDTELTLYQEVGIDAFSFFIEMPYRMLEPQVNLGASGFVDLNLGTKSLLLDCELMQITFQFRTFIPTGAPGRGLGTG